MNTTMWESLETCIQHPDNRMSYLLLPLTPPPPVRGVREHVIEMPECHAHAASTGGMYMYITGMESRDGWEWDINMDHGLNADPFYGVSTPLHSVLVR